MSERTDYPAGVPCWVDTAQADLDAALAFYGALFGWQFAGPGPMAGDPLGRYFVARLRGRDVAGISSLAPEENSHRPAWNTYVSVRSADECATKAGAAGGKVLVEPFDAAPAGRMAVLADPAGAVFCAWEAGARKGAQLVNEPGAWAMSQLITADPTRAEDFYGFVLGWQAEAFSSGAMQVTLWRLPGYVGGEPLQPVPRDLVGVMVPADMPPQWGVDFWVSDADRAAADAVTLGGSVIVAPRDIPGFRNAVLADPSGAAFSVSQLMIEGV
jgi:predicted enzyme related to lactoylglutathione lyase